MNELNFYSANEVYAETFYQLPKVFFTNKKYKKLSSDAKIAYAILKDRFNYSIKNKWCDENDNIFFIYTVKELQEILNCGTEKISKIKKELTQVELLFQKRMGLNKPNRLYLLKPIAESQDVYLQVNQDNNKTLDNKGVSKIEIPEQTGETLDNKGVSKIEIPEQTSETLDNKGVSKIENNQYIYHLDTLQDTLLDTGHNSIDLENYAKQIESEIDKSQTNSIPEPAKQTLLTFSANNYKIVENQIGMIYRAKKEVAMKYNVLLLIENDEWGFINAIKTISLAIYKDKKSIHKIKNYDNYFYMSIKKYFEQQAERITFRQEIENEELPPVPMTNWLEN